MKRQITQSDFSYEKTGFIHKSPISTQIIGLKLRENLDNFTRLTDLLMKIFKTDNISNMEIISFLASTKESKDIYYKYKKHKIPAVLMKMTITHKYTFEKYEHLCSFCNGLRDTQHGYIYHTLQLSNNYGHISATARTKIRHSRNYKEAINQRTTDIFNINETCLSYFIQTLLLSFYYKSCILLLCSYNDQLSLFYTLNIDIIKYIVYVINIENQYCKPII